MSHGSLKNKNKKRKKMCKLRPLSKYELVYRADVKLATLLLRLRR